MSVSAHPLLQVCLTGILAAATSCTRVSDTRPAMALPAPLAQEEEAPEEEQECARGEAEPLAKQAVFPRTTFTREADNISAVETISSENGDQVLIHNTGCESYVLSFRIETTRFPNAPEDLAFWLPEAVALMEGLLPGLDAPVPLDDALKVLHAQLEANRLKPGKEIAFGGGEIRSYALLKSISGAAGKTGVEWMFVVGPL